MTTNVTTPVLYALGTVTTAVSFAVIAAGAGVVHLGASPPRASRQRRRQGSMTGRRRARVLRLATAGPGDTAPLASAIDRRDVDPATIVAIVGKTEGNGCVNDFTRGYATLALKLLLSERLKCPMARSRRVSPSSCRAEPRVGCRRICWCSAARRRPRRQRAAAGHRRWPDARFRARGDRPGAANRCDP